jgi:hypothetical protein
MGRILPQPPDTFGPSLLDFSSLPATKRRMTTAPQPRTDRITRWLLIAIGVYSFALVSLLNVIVPFTAMLAEQGGTGMKREIVMLCAVPLLVLAGCADAPQQPPQSQSVASQQPASVWADSEDGVLSLRLGAPDTTVDCEDPITVVVELRNNSTETVTVFRPLGDLNAVSSWFDPIGPKGSLRYTGPIPSQPIGKYHFVELRPGESICEWHDLLVDNFAGSDQDGQYTIRYSYAATDGYRETADRIGLKGFWTGEIKSRPVTVTKRKSAGSGQRERIGDLVSIQFPKDEYVFTLAEVAKGVRFEYRVVVRRDFEGVVPRAQDMGRAAGPGSSGLYPFEKISGDGQSYSLADIGLGQPKDSPRGIQKGTHLLSFDWDGRNWAGPSDTSNPKGPPFPPGTYQLTVRLTGEVVTPDGRRQYDISRFASVRLVP